MFDIKEFTNSTASAARLDYFNNFASRKESKEEGSDVTTVTIYPATRAKFAIMAGHTLNDLIFAVAKIVPTAFHEICRSLLQGNFPEFKATRIEAHNIFTNLFMISLYATGILFPGTINRTFLEMGEEGISVEGSPSQEEQDALEAAGSANHVLRPVIRYNEEWFPTDDPKPFVLNFKVVKV